MSARVRPLSILPIWNMLDLDYSQLKGQRISRSWRVTLAGATRVVPSIKSQLQSARRRDRRAEAGYLPFLRIRMLARISSSRTTMDDRVLEFLDMGTIPY